MDSIYTEDLIITLSVCGFDGKLTLTGALDIFMDVASLHEEEIGFGIIPMEKQGLYWIIGKNRVRFIKRPGLMDRVIVKTWFTKPSRLFGNRQYIIEDLDGNLLVIGETEWLVVTEHCAKILPIKEYINPECMCMEKRLFDSEAKRVSSEFNETELIGKYTVLPNDIDYIGHMNNAAYSRTILSFIPTEEMRKNPIKEAEIFYSLQCFEGDVLNVYSRNIDNQREFGAFKQDGRVVMTARFYY